MKEHLLTAEPTHSVWDNRLPPRIAVSPGDVVQMQCLDASGGQVSREASIEEFLAIDRGRIHALTGPVSVEGARLGDVLEIRVLKVAHQGWAWTSIIPGLGLLDDRFTEPYLFHWELDETISASLHPAIIPLRPFCGVMGVAPSECGSFRTRPPGYFGGNMDVKELSSGSTLYLPVMNDGALFSAGDAHAAQGDGEVCINGMECPADVRLEFRLHKGHVLSGPVIESAPCTADTGPEWMIVESSPDPMLAARTATSRMIDLLVAHWSFSAINAYLLCSVAMNLRLSQVVNRPMITVCAAISKNVLPGRRLFAL